MAKKLLETVSSFKNLTHRSRCVPATADRRDDMINHIGPMRAYALALTLDRATADDLVESALLRALKNPTAFGPDTDMRMWLLTVLHDTFHAARETAGRASIGVGDRMDEMVTKPRLAISVTPESFRLAFESLPLNQREALALTGAEHLSFRHAATVCGCSVSVLKKCANDGRDLLAASLPFCRGSTGQSSIRQLRTAAELAPFS